MGLFWQIAQIALWAGVVGLGLLLWGALRALDLLSWRLDQWELASPHRRRGITVGSHAPNFGLPAACLGRACARLRHLVGRKALLVFADDARDRLPELRRLQRQGNLQVLIIQNSTDDEKVGVDLTSPRGRGTGR